MQRRVTNTMLILRNIKREGNTISADYYPEGEAEFGHIEIDSISGEIVFLQKAPIYMHSPFATHARYELMRLSNLKKLPEERTVLWY